MSVDPWRYACRECENRSLERRAGGPRGNDTPGWKCRICGTFMPEGGRLDLRTGELEEVGT